MQCLVLSSVLFATLSIGEFANILGIFPLAAKSHNLMIERLMKRLATKGHNVDVATHYPSKEGTPGYNELNLTGSAPIYVDKLPLNYFEKWSHYDWLYFMSKDCGIGVCTSTLKTQALQDLKKSQKKYDLVITEIFGSDCMLGFGYFFNAPTVSIISSIALPWAGDRIGNSDNPSYIPTYFTSSETKMTLYERIENVIYSVVSKFVYDFHSLKGSDQVIRDFFGEDVPSLEELVRNTSLILVNSHFSFSYARPAVSNFIEVGGLHLHEPKDLPKYFEDLLKTDTKGIILLSMGTMLMSESLSPGKLQGIFDAFAELPYKVLWKATSERFPDGLKIPQNIHFEKWMPQMDILCHPNVKLFVSHGGLMSSQEAIYCGVPRLGIPFFSDQDNNICAAETSGTAIKVAYNDINKETILNAARKLLGDPTYKQNADTLSAQFKDRSMSALDTAVYWIEYVIRHKGAPHLRSSGADLPWYQYFLIDVILVLLVFTIVMLLIMVLTLKFIIYPLYRNQK